MGFCSDKGVLEGLFGGLNTPKNGKKYLSILSPGPKIDKVEIASECPLPAGLAFGTPVVVTLTHVEQKFQDFNGSFSTARTASFAPPAK